MGDEIDNLEAVLQDPLRRLGDEFCVTNPLHAVEASSGEERARRTAASAAAAAVTNTTTSTTASATAPPPLGGGGGGAASHTTVPTVLSLQGFFESKHAADLDRDVMSSARKVVDRDSGTSVAPESPLKRSPAMEALRMLQTPLYPHAAGRAMMETKVPLLLASDAPAAAAAPTREQLMDEAIAEAFRNGSMMPPFQDSALEDELLREAGRWPVGPGGRMIDLPPCSQGLKCFAVTLHIAPRAGFPLPAKERRVLIRTMTRVEFDTVLKGGEPPRQERMCVACHRHTLQRAMMACHGEDTRIKIDKRQVLQTYCNIKDAPGGYHKAYMLLPSSTGWHGLSHPVARFPPSAVSWYQLPHGQWAIDQSALVVQPPEIILPYLGETMANFRLGVAGPGTSPQ